MICHSSPHFICLTCDLFPSPVWGQGQGFDQFLSSANVVGSTKTKEVQSLQHMTWNHLHLQSQRIECGPQAPPGVFPSPRLVSNKLTYFVLMSYDAFIEIIKFAWSLAPFAVFICLWLPTSNCCCGSDWMTYHIICRCHSGSNRSFGLSAIPTSACRHTNRSAAIHRSVT